MPRGAHLDVQATASARLSRVLRDKRSFIALDGRVFLEGKDVRRARARVFGRDEGECVDCSREVNFDTWEGLTYPGMELSHEKPKSLGGDDSDANLRTRCRTCHRKRDLHGQPGHF
jgi:5-methylcytosine-specific restriction endonuclease McrA